MYWVALGTSSITLNVVEALQLLNYLETSPVLSILLEEKTVNTEYVPIAK